MFGIDFPGSPRVDEPFILESWDDIPPMRREFDTRAYSEARYFPRPGREKIVPREYMREQLYPDLNHDDAEQNAAQHKGDHPDGVEQKDT
jgi:NADH-quinone oxidoreductase subunit C